MKRFLILAGAVTFLAALVTSQAAAVDYPPRWQFHQYVSGPNGGHVTVHGTINCTPIGPALFDGTTYYCQTVSGWVPPWCNDYRVINRWLPPYWTCGNVDTFKVAVPYWDNVLLRWRLRHLRDWLLAHIQAGSAGAACPTIGDRTGNYQFIHVVVNLGEWLENPEPLQDEYTITNGECPQLPGYLVGTTPIVFDSLGTEPFTTTRFTGTLWRSGDVTFANPMPNPALNEWGVIALVLALAGVAVVFVLRRRAKAAA
jgi:hypothetical protein